jgi:hypothetical protein
MLTYRKHLPRQLQSNPQTRKTFHGMSSCRIHLLPVRKGRVVTTWNMMDSRRWRLDSKDRVKDVVDNRIRASFVQRRLPRKYFPLQGNGELKMMEKLYSQL